VTVIVTFATGDWGVVFHESLLCDGDVEATLKRAQRKHYDTLLCDTYSEYGCEVFTDYRLLVAPSLDALMEKMPAQLMRLIQLDVERSERAAVTLQAAARMLIERRRLEREAPYLPPNPAIGYPGGSAFQEAKRNFDQPSVVE